MAVFLVAVRDLAMSNRKNIVAFQHVTTVRSSGGIVAVSFQLGVGEVYVWLGGPSSGKTAIVDLVLGFARADSGTVEVDGMDPRANVEALRRSTAFVDGRSRLAGPMTPIDHLEFLAKLTRIVCVPQERINALRLMGLQDRYLSHSMDNLPNAAHSCVFLALAWLRRLPLLVLDDPTSGFDSVASSTFVGALGEFRSAGISVLLTTSDVLLAAQVGDHIGVLKRGEKVAERHRSQLLQESLTALYSDYVGRSDSAGNRQ